MRNHVEQPSGLIRVLLGPASPEGDQDDAAMGLAKYNEPEAEAALLTAATDPTRHENVADQAGVSLAQIWLRRGGFKAEKLTGLTWPALKMIIPSILRKHPEWEANVRGALQPRADITIFSYV
jgi:hypothetical protein